VLGRNRISPSAESRSRTYPGVSPSRSNILLAMFLYYSAPSFSNPQSPDPPDGLDPSDNRLPHARCLADSTTSFFIHDIRFHCRLLDDLLLRFRYSTGATGRAGLFRWKAPTLNTLKVKTYFRGPEKFRFFGSQLLYFATASNFPVSDPNYKLHKLISLVPFSCHLFAAEDSENLP